MRRGVFGAVTALLLCGVGQAQSAAPSQPLPSFDVATVRPNDIGSQSWGIDSNTGYFNGTNVPFRVLLQAAYEVRTELISGLPDWAEHAHYDVKAKAVDADPAELKTLSNDEQTAMFRGLLVDRFHLQTHLETKQLPVYDLVIAKGGPKLQAAVHPATGEDVFHGQGPKSMGVHDGHLIAHVVTMDVLTKALAGQVNRAVIDKTGLTGEYDVVVDFAPDYGNGPSADATEPPILLRYKSS